MLPVAVTILAVLPVFLVGALAVQIRDELEFSEFRLGVLVTLFALTGVLASPVMGRFVDRRGERIGMLSSALLGGLATAAMASARAWSVLAIASVVAGLGNSAAHPSANLALAKNVAAPRQGLAFGLKQSAIPSAILLAGLAVPLVALTVGWRWAFLGAAFGSLVLAATVRRGASGEPGAKPVAARARVKPGPLLLVAVVAFFAISGVQSLAAFLVEAGSSGGYDAGDMGFLLAAASFIGIAVRIASGWLGDRLPGRSLLGVIAGYMAVGAVGLSVIAFQGSFPVFVIGTILGLGAGWSWNGLMHFVVVRGYPEAPAEATSILQAGLLAGAAVGPLLFGWVVTVDSYAAAWFLASGALATAALLALVAWRMLLARQIEADDQREALASTGARSRSAQHEVPRGLK